MELSTFQAFKLEVVAFTGLAKDALHIYVGLATMLAVAAVFRRSLGSWLPLAAVLAVALLGEALDARDNLRAFGRWNVAASVHDIANTLFWPVILWLLARYSVLLKRT